jgi:hypothetical protein
MYPGVWEGSIARQEERERRKERQRETSGNRAEQYLDVEDVFAHGWSE